MWLLSPVKMRMHTSSNEQVLHLSRKQRERGERLSSDVQQNDREGGVGED